jgi:hypothetical protein
VAFFLGVVTWLLGHAKFMSEAWQQRLTAGGATVTTVGFVWFFIYRVFHAPYVLHKEDQATHRESIDATEKLRQQAMAETNAVKADYTKATNAAALSVKVAAVRDQVIADYKRACEWSDHAMVPREKGDWIPDAARARLRESREAVSGSPWEQYQFPDFPGGVPCTDPRLIGFLKDLGDSLTKLEGKIDARANSN